MKRIFALILSAALLLSLAACGSTPAATDPTGTGPALPTYPEVKNPVTFFTISYGRDMENIRSVTVFANEDGTAYLEYVGEVKKMVDFNATLFHGIATALKKTELPGLNGKDAIQEGEANGSMFVEYADGSILAVTYNGTVSEEFIRGYEAMDAFFVQATQDVPVYVPAPQVIGEVDQTLKEELLTIVNGSGMAMPDALYISGIEKDDGFAYAAGLSKADGIGKAATLAPVMSGSAYSLVVVTLEEGTDGQTVCGDFAANISWNKWVCVSATDALIATKGNMVLCLVAADSLYDQTANGIRAAGWTTVKTLGSNS